MPFTKTCLRCNKKFNQTEIGKLNCWIHPIPIDSIFSSDRDTGRYMCCGSDPYLWDHEVNGCHRIDHVSTTEELEKILRKPFVCIPAHLIKITSERDQYNMYVGNPSQLEYNYRFKMSQNREYDINLSSEYRDMMSRIEKKGSKGGESSASYYVYEEEQITGEEGGSFVPFYIVRRMDYVVDRDKRREILLDR